MKAYELMNHSNRSNPNGRNFTGLNVPKMTGKMASVDGKTMRSLSTSVLLNDRCMDRINSAMAAGDTDCICTHCFAVNTLLSDPMEVRRNGMNRNLERNFHILTSGFLTWEDIPVITDTFFRFESHGDLNNSIQLINYLAFCEKALSAGSKTQFALWTKNPDILETTFEVMGLEKPSNLNIIVSSSQINTIFDYKKPYVDKVFTVFDCMESALAAGHKLNCCVDSRNSTHKKCVNCQLCYTKNSTRFVNECLR